MTKGEFRELLAEELDISESVLTDDISMSDDLGVDSLEIIKLICLIEDRYDVEVDESHIDLLDNLDSAYGYINALIEENQ